MMEAGPNSCGAEAAFPADVAHAYRSKARATSLVTAPPLFGLTQPLLLTPVWESCLAMVASRSLLVFSQHLGDLHSVSLLLLRLSGQLAWQTGFSETSVSI